MTEKAYIGLNISPIVEHSEKELPHEEKDSKMYKVTISCGGGMGGSIWDENVYIKTSDYKKALFEAAPFLRVKDVITEEERVISMRNVVEIVEIHGYVVQTTHDNHNFPLKHRMEYYFRPLRFQFVFASHTPEGYRFAEVDKVVSY